MNNTVQDEMIKAGVHFGHLKRKWNPKMAPYILMERNGIHLIDVNKTQAKLEEAAAAVKQIAKSGKKILFVATKKQAKDIIAKAAKSVDMPYITERWPGGFLTNFATQRKSVKKMQGYEKLMADAAFDNMSKREKLQVSRQKVKMERFLSSIADLVRLPSALFIVDVVKEHISVAEAAKLNIPTIAICDTNSDPTQIDFPIPANDDASQSIELIMNAIVKAIEEGMAERKVDKEMEREKEIAMDEESEDAVLASHHRDESNDDETEPASELSGTSKKSSRPRKPSAGGSRKKQS
ncbi:MAG: 30S ribosomal protein S2 [Bacteroidia bacterium]|nr:30S ribosomal protein S2 [Bacteroidia bacterium]MCZ2276380.1 30S ribosomal protein S2 [Bacteroidia bacterium]